MKAQKIERVQFAESGMDSARMELANKAAKLLGYTKLQSAAGSTLLDALRKLEITPLITSQVIDYKNSKEKTGVWSGRIVGLWFAFATMMFCGAASFLFVLDTQWKLKGWADFFATAGSSLSVVATIIGFIYALHYGLTDGQDRGTRNAWVWRKFRIENYTGSVPEFVLAKATAIKELVPTAIFQIEQLVIQNEKAEMNAYEKDPFLIVKEGEESYYIDVWDEKEYERTI